MEMRGSDIYINGILAWSNPDRSGVMRGINANHIGNKLWINGELVYEHPEEVVSAGEKKPIKKVVPKSQEGWKFQLVITLFLSLPFFFLWFVLEI